MGAIERGVWQQDRELVSAVASNHIVRARNGTGQQRAKTAKGLISGPGPREMVKTFEMIEIDQ